MLDKSLAFLKLLRELEKVERTVFRPNDKRENDVEHSYQVAMMSWFLSDKFGLNLSSDKLLKYALAHDLIEAYSGDTCVYVKNPAISTNSIETKEEREAEAFSKVKKEFGDFRELIEIIEAYEAKKDEESIFVYEVDKILPPLNAYLDGGYGWNKLGLTLEEVKKEKRKKVTHTKQVIDLLEEALSRFEKEESKLFVN